MKYSVLLVIIAFFLNINFVKAQSNKVVYFNTDTKLYEVDYFHDNGLISQTGFLDKEGKLHGEWLHFDETGKKITIAKFENGSKVGTWMHWNKECITEVTYDKSKILTVKEFPLTSSYALRKF